MPDCIHCSTKLKRTDIIKSIYMFAYAPIQCTNCGVTYAIDFSSRIKVVLLTITPVPLVYSILNFKLLTFLFLYALWLALIMYLTPYCVSYHEVRENKSSLK